MKIRIAEIICDVVSHNNLTSHVNTGVGRLSNTDILRIILHWTYGKSVSAIARDFQVTRQRIYQRIKRKKESGEYLKVRKPGKKFRSVDIRTEEIILESYRTIMSV